MVSAGFTHTNPGNVNEWTERIHIQGNDSAEMTSDFVMLMPGSFQALAISLLRGRNFSWNDDDRAQRVAIVSQNLAEKLFPSCDPIGQHLDIVTEPKWQNLEIVGIVFNASFYDVRKQAPPTVYVPTTQYGDYMGWSSVIVQTRLPAKALEKPVRQVIDSMGHEYVTSVKTIRQNINRSILQERVIAVLSSVFGGLALLLAAIGLYGQIAYSVTRRTREIGIRIALGARQVSVQRMVLREALSLALLGIVIGLPCVLVASRMIASLLFGVSPRDPFTVAIVILVLLAVSVLASWLPARRAMRVDPIIALRYE